MVLRLLPHLGVPRLGEFEEVRSIVSLEQVPVADVLSKPEPVKGGTKGDAKPAANDGAEKKPGGLRGLLGGKK